jgi:hypothetical protein
MFHTPSWPTVMHEMKCLLLVLFPEMDSSHETLLIRVGISKWTYAIMNYLKLILSLLLPFLLVLSCSSKNTAHNDSSPVDHSSWDAMLKEFVNEEGRVDYKAWKKDELRLDNYLKILESSTPENKDWSKEQRLAYWINAYNAFTVKLILDYYPLESIKDIGSKFQIPFVNTPWDIKFININGENYDLNNIEHNILRKDFVEPRIHFAIVCASISCPSLRREAYAAEKLEDQLNEQARKFLSNASKNEIGQSEIRISKIFNWFKGDFTRKGSLIEFLNQYSATEIHSNAKVRYMTYDWGLNKWDR